MADSNDARLQVVLEAKIDKLIERLGKANQATSGWAAQTQKRLDGVDGQWAKLFGKGNPGKALDDVFSRSRLAAIDAGSARIPIFGSALAELGPLGLVAAAGVGAFALAMTQTRAAAAFGDEIGDMASKLHVTTDALQEYRYAARLAGDEEKGADEALESFGVTLGKAQAGLPKAIKGFKELGFNKAQVDSFKTVEDALTAVVARIETVKSNPLKDAVVDQLGLSGMKQLVEGGLEGMQRLKNEAKTLGFVMDAGLIAKAGEANDKFETLEKVIDIQLKSAFVDLAPVLLNLLQIAADFAREFADVAATFQSIQNRTTDQLTRKRDGIIERMNTAEGRGVPYATTPGGGPGYLPGEKGSLQKQLDRVNAELAKRPAAGATVPGVPGTAGLVDLDAQKAAAQAAREALQRAGASQQLVDDATRDELQARRALVKDLFEQADLARQAVDAEAKQRDDRVAAQLAQGKITKAAADEALARYHRADDEKKAGIAAGLTTDLEQDRLAKHRELAGILDATTEIYRGLARTVEERRKLELKLLDKQHQDRLEDLRVRRDQAGREGRGDDVKEVGRLIDAENDNYGASKKQINQQNQRPLADALDKAPRSIAELGEAFETLEAQGLAQLNSGLADAIVNSKSLGAVAANVFKQLEIQILQMLIEMGEREVFTALGLPGFAEGGFTGSSPAHKIAGVVHGSEYVFDAASTSRIGVGNLEALRKGMKGYANGGFVGVAAMSIPRHQAGGQSLQVFDLRGSLVTEELYRTIDNKISAGKAEAIAQGGQLGASMALNRVQQSTAMRLGRAR